MKQLLCILLLAGLLLPTQRETKLSEKDLYRIAVNAHQFTTRPHLNKEQLKKIPKEDRPDLAWEQDFLQTMDPTLGRPAPERLLPVYQQVAQGGNALMTTPGAASSPWVERGPSNVAGRTRAIAYDPNDVTGKKVWAGGVTGGLWYNNDITSSSSQWVAVNDFWDNIAITSIAFDPTNTNTIYVGTGEGWGAGASRGAGIWKSTNGGTTWSHLSSTSNFYYVNDLVVRDESGNGVLYVALRGNYYANQWHGSSQQGLRRSTNGGTSFTQVLPNVPGTSINFAAADIEIAADNTLWVGTTTSSYSASDRGGGRVLSSSNGTSWTISYSHTNGERVELACAPNDANYVYAIIEVSNQVGGIVRTTNGGTSWSNRSEPNDADNGIPATDFSRGQAWYDLIIEVDPNDKNTVITGAIDLFRSTDGANTWSQISKWSNNNNLAGLSCSYVHADQHQIVFKPGSSNEVLFGNDGGVFYTSNVSSAASSNVISDRNNGYNVTQFYACAIHPTSGSNYFLAGAQDNGTQKFNSGGMNNTTRVTGGDGGYCFIDQTNANYQVSSYVYNSYWRSTNGGSSFGSFFQNDQSTGKFINPTDYDDNMNILYSARTNSTINRVKNMTSSPSIGNFSVTGMNSMASHLRVSPYTTTSTTLFVGTGAGDLYKITNADGGSPSSTSIGGGLPSGNISCVEIGANENELLVTFTNYGVNSVWYTSNGGTSWSSKEGNLPDMPVRWALFNPNDRNEVILATEVGVWSTTNFNSSSPSWTSSNSGLANVRVDMLQIRQSDFEVIAATFGRGLFSSSGFGGAVTPVADFSANKTTACTSETVNFSDLSSNAPTSWSWSFTPSTVTYVNGTSSSSQNPEVSFNSVGTYQVSLSATNSAGSDLAVKNAYVTVNASLVPSVSISASANSICSGTQVNFTASPTNGGGSANYQWKINGSNVGPNSPNFSSSSLTNGDVVTVEMQSSIACPTLSSVSSSGINMVVTNSVTPSLNISASATSICSGTMVNFTASPSGGGGSPTYQWKVNGMNVGNNSANFSSSTLNNNDVVSCELTSSIACVTSSNAVSNSVNMTVNTAVTPSITASASTTSICAGEVVTFSALPVNGGVIPLYQWKVNGMNVGMNSSSFTTTSLAHNDVVTVELTSSAPCATTNTATSTGITMTVTPTPAITINTVLPKAALCAGDSLSLMATVNNFGYAGSGSWSGPGIQNGTFMASSAGNGTHSLTYTYNYTNPPLCSDSKSMQVVVEIIPKPTISVSGSTLTCNESGYNYQWFESGNPIAGATSRSYNITANGNYSVQIGLTSCMEVSDPEIIQNFGTDELKALLGFELYPNPTTGRAYFELSNWGSSDVQYELISFNGARVMNKALYAGNNLKEELDLSNLASGIYTLRIVAGDHVLLERITKQ